MTWAWGPAQLERAREKGISRVVFDRGGYVYHGRVKAFADGAREGAERRDEEEDLGHRETRRPYSPSRRSGVRSSGSERSISLVKMRSERL